MTTQHDRALGALTGLALGDALGMPTQLLSRAEVVARYGTLLDGLQPGPADHPIAAGLPAGSTTDDTAQALLLADQLVRGSGRLDQHAWAAALLDWETRMRAAGSLDLLGPSTRGALDALAAGTPVDQTGRAGTTNGAAMRVAPVGIATGARPGPLVDAVVEASVLTHGTGVALAGAAAVAGAVSAGVDGADLTAALSLGLQCARLAATRGRWVAGADVAARIAWAVELAAGLGDEALLDRVTALVGTSLATQESVPAAFAFAVARADDPWLALRLAASAGGDADTIAAMTGAILGAVHGAAAFDPQIVHRVEEVNHLQLAATATALLRLRTVTGALPAGGGPDVAELRPRGPAPVPGRPPQPHHPTPPGHPARPDHPAPPDRLTQPDRPVQLVYVGQAVVDLVTRVPRLPAPGGDVLAGPLRPHAGGGVNVMLAAVRLGRSVLYAGCHGTGPHGDLVRATLAAHGVQLALPRSVPADTGTVLVLVDDDGERTFVTSPGAEAQLTAAELARVQPRPVDLVVLSGYALAHRANRAAVLDWLPRIDPRVRVVLDPGPLFEQVPGQVAAVVLARADWVSANQAEAAALTGLDDPAAAAVALARRARGRAVLRRGPDGCILADGDRPLRRLPAPQVSVVDLTGAGDTFTAAFADGLAGALDPALAAGRATRAAAWSVTRPGPATGPTTAELDAWVP
jgi:ADP-ribosylglycohydrolase/sugar/nucleoside kinase (ribokinase family)